jgi:tetratricopeptide (TPR) repeat protein
MKPTALLLSLLFFAGCASFQASSDLQKGRVALLQGMPLAAIPYLEQATAADGTARYSSLQETALTYLGRAQYEARRYGEARKALERALLVNPDDGIARLYLGLTTAREGNHNGAKKEILSALKQLDNTLEFIIFNTSSGSYWDPSGKIRRELAALQRDAAEANPSLDHLLARLENIGVSLEEEMDLARRDESFDNRRNSGGDM